jgi:uncharacterized protein
VADEARVNSLTSKELAIINQVKTLYKEKIKVNCTACAYCMPCPAGVNIPGCFTVYNDYSIFSGTSASETKDRYKFLYDFRIGSKAHASNCIGCGKCETHCPQSIEIRKELKNVQEVFE